MASLRNLLGDHEAQEVWTRSQASEEFGVDCPSCLRPMKLIQEPGWVGQWDVDVCNTCYMVWIEEGEHPEIPHPHKDIDPKTEEKQKEVAKAQARAIGSLHNEKEEWTSEGPSSLIKQLPGLFMMPVEEDTGFSGTWPWVTWFLILSSLFGYFEAQSVTRLLGEHPQTLALFESLFLHPNVGLLCVNLYFAYILFDDIEYVLGSLGLAVFGMITLGLFLTLQHFLFPGEIHLGLTPFVLAGIVFYMLSFPKRRMIYLVPALHLIRLPKGGRAYSRGFRWIRVSLPFLFLTYFIALYVCLKLSGFQGLVSLKDLIGLLILTSLSGAVIYYLFSDARHLRES